LPHLVQLRDCGLVPNQVYKGIGVASHIVEFFLRPVPKEIKALLRSRTAFGRSLHTLQRQAPGVFAVVVLRLAVDPFVEDIDVVRPDDRPHLVAHTAPGIQCRKHSLVLRTLRIVQEWQQGFSWQARRYGDAACFQNSRQNIDG